MKRYTLGIDVGGTKTAYGLFDGDMTMIDKRVTKTNTALSPSDMLDEMALICKEMLNENSIGVDALKGVGAGFPCHIDYEKGISIFGSNLPTWENVPVKEMLSKRLQTRVEIDNDANVAALAEHRLGAGSGNKNMIYVTVSTGVGGGIIINNQLFRGDYGAAGEIGHMIISENGPLCSCGNCGCLMSIASGPKMIKYVLDEMEKGYKSTVYNYVQEGEELSGRHIGLAAADNDNLCKHAIKLLAENLGIMFVNLYQIFNIKHYVLGGSVAKLGETLFSQIVNKVQKATQFATDYPIHIVPADLGDDVGIVGAALLID